MPNMKELLAAQLLRTKFNQDVVINPLIAYGVIPGEPFEVADQVAQSVVNDFPDLDDMSQLEWKSVIYAFSLFGFTPVNE